MHVACCMLQAALQAAWCMVHAAYFIVSVAYAHTQNSRQTSNNPRDVVWVCRRRGAGGQPNGCQRSQDRKRSLLECPVSTPRGPVEGPSRAEPLENSSSTLPSTPRVPLECNSSTPRPPRKCPLSEPGKTI
jgi:hypothetical protein